MIIDVKGQLVQSRTSSLESSWVVKHSFNLLTRMLLLFECDLEIQCAMRDAEESRLEAKKRITHIGVVLTEPLSGLKCRCTSVEPARAHERHNLEIAIRALVMSDFSLDYHDIQMRSALTKIGPCSAVVKRAETSDLLCGIGHVT